MKHFAFVAGQISEWSGKILSFIAVFVIGAISYEVFARYVFNSPTLWAHETMTYLCGIYYIVGGAYTLYLRKHVSVDIFYRRFSRRIKAVVDLVTFPLFFVYIGVLLWTGSVLGWESFTIRETTGSAWNPALYPVKLMLPVGALLILIQGLAKFICDLNIATTTKKHEH